MSNSGRVGNACHAVLEQCCY